MLTSTSLTPELLHTIAIGIPVILGGIGSGIGQGIAGYGALQAMYRQSKGIEQITRTMILGLALIETGVILSLVISLMILFGGTKNVTLGIGLSELGMSLAIGLSALIGSIASSFAVKEACKSIARQPFFSQKIMTLMLLAQSIIEAAVVFAFVVALLIKVSIKETTTVIEGIKFLGAGLAIGIGTIGPSIGQALFSHASCNAAGLNKKTFGKLLTFSLLSQAVIQTPIIFCLIISIIIIFKPVIAITTPLIAFVSFIVPAFTISIGSMGTAISIGYSSAKNCRSIALKPEHYPLLLRTSLLAQAIIESSAIYALIVSLILMTKTL